MMEFCVIAYQTPRGAIVHGTPLPREVSDRQLAELRQPGTFAFHGRPAYRVCCRYKGAS